MRCTLNRRDLLLGGLGTAAALGGVGRSAGDQPQALPTPVDRSVTAPVGPVAVQRCASYDPQAFRGALDAACALLGDVKKLVENKTVTIKINLTGMVWNPLFGMPAYETYQTHPVTLAALCAALHDAGARRIIVAENLYWNRPFEQSLLEAGWDVRAIQAAGGHKVTFEDTRNKGSYAGYSRLKVAWGGYIFPAFDVNPAYDKTDVLVSLTKLKQHATAGVTGAIKNFFGNTPSAIYGDDGPGEHALKHRAKMFHSGKSRPPDGAPQELAHGLPQVSTVRVPRITADIFAARPSDLDVIDGIRSISGGEGPWNRGVALVEPKLLIAGRNGVCTDAVCTALMGFDPQAAHGQRPFQGDNHLRLLAAAGVGSNDLQRIDVRGLPIARAVFPYDRQS